ncbi:hypothetical protein CR205_11120 [Alteribacter lacisalsi]|uniref:Uncharacterized protein n=1 Tax=Alteribacter lacisalsi TaxID=2045244 RepID=A0A2W0HZ22_9BACI|nr:DUF6241 domain-containing protein [Alteribacter lacisalsi]PYZ99078.1 hypothetical protein CR205_11120 [Alteribacter lacisalsi]
MGKMKLAALMIVFFTAIGYGTYFWLGSQEASGIDTSIIAEVEEEIGGPIVVEELIDMPTEDEVAERFPLDMRESQMQRHIHHMSHQKIYASDKWGPSLMITDKKLDRLLEVVEANEYTYVGVYRGILTRWRNGDFSTAVEDHNRIWQMKDGTVGEALRLLSEEEELAYILRNHY